jgi:hypothetical protein
MREQPSLKRNAGTPQCHPEPCPESSHVILDLFQDQGLTISGASGLEILNQVQNDSV